jgi:hypothetical protein
MKKQMISVLGEFSKVRLKVKTALCLTKRTSREESKIPLAVIWQETFERLDDEVFN